jgi:hypothetical protein
VEGEGEGEGILLYTVVVACQLVTCQLVLAKSTHTPHPRECHVQLTMPPPGRPQAPCSRYLYGVRSV